MAFDGLHKVYSILIDVFFLNPLTILYLNLILYVVKGFIQFTYVAATTAAVRAADITADAAASLPTFAILTKP
jgi:hypothetical protein